MKCTFCTALHSKVHVQVHVHTSCIQNAGGGELAGREFVTARIRICIPQKSRQVSYLERTCLFRANVILCVPY